MNDNFCENVTLNPWQNNEVGYETDYFNKVNAEYIKISSPPIYTQITKKNLDLQNLDLKGFSERDYLDRTGKLDSLYHEAEKQLYPGSYRIYGVFEMPVWAQELGSLGMSENEEVTINFNVSTLASNLDGSVLHIGDVVKIYDNIYGWKYYEIENALPKGMKLGQYLMWQIVAKKSDLEGYIGLEDESDIIQHDVIHEPINPDDKDTPYEEVEDPDPEVTKPRPRVY